jgi:hypothetical protein
MKDEISQREVLNNLIRFKDSLLDRREKLEQAQAKISKRIYPALLNSKTGEMRFAKKIYDLEHHMHRKGAKKESAADWKEIQLIVNEKPFHFEVPNLKSSDVASAAWDVLSETLRILNQKAQQIQVHPTGLLPEEMVLSDLSTIQLTGSKDQIQDLPGWVNSMGRIEAERILDGKSEGTYVLREGDELTLSISFHFEEENPLKIHPYLVTVVEKEGKISDILLLQTNKGWLLYHDDPNLQDSVLYQYYPSAKIALEQLKATVKRPLQRFQ